MKQSRYPPAPRVCRDSPKLVSDFSSLSRQIPVGLGVLYQLDQLHCRPIRVLFGQNALKKNSQAFPLVQRDQPRWPRPFSW